MTNIDEIIAKYKEPVAPKCLQCRRKMRRWREDSSRSERWFWQCPTATAEKARERHMAEVPAPPGFSTAPKPDLAVVALARELQQMREAFENVCAAPSEVKFTVGDRSFCLMFVARWQMLTKKEWALLSNGPERELIGGFDTAWEAYQAAVKIAEGEQ